MRSKSVITWVLCALLIAGFSANGHAQGFKRGLTGKIESSSEKKPKSAKKSDLKPFNTLIKDRVKVEGLFTFYVDTTDKSVLMAITPDQLDKVYLAGETVFKSASVFSDAGRMYRTYPFYFTRVGENIQFMEKNVRLRADTSSTLKRAVEYGVSDHLLESTKILSEPHDSTKAVLIKADELFVQDATNLSYWAGKVAKTGFSFDKKNSYISNTMSFPKNSEIDARLHYASRQPLSATTMQNPYSAFHTHRFSLMELPESDFQPRIADERVGTFVTVFQDYTTPAENSPYVRYVERWNLKKKNPEARISAPVEPITFWVQNTVPPEYKDIVAEGIEFWNGSFDKIGYRNAVVAKIMPDTAGWDPADIRYSTVQWIVPGSGPAVGPSRANPYTGEIFDADVRIPADFIRHMFNVAERYVSPLSFDGMEIEDPDDPLKLIEEFKHSSGFDHSRFCNYAEESMEHASRNLAYIQSLPNDFANKDSLTKEFVHSYLVQLVAHEVGHCLGFRHNFKASSIYTFAQINDPEFTREHSNVGTIMDYPAAHVSGPDREQGEFYGSVPGPYDDFMVQYAYVDLGDLSTQEELPELGKIAQKATDSLLAYGTDEDAFGYSVKSPDPDANLFDLGSDPLASAEHDVMLTRALWANTLGKFDEPGTKWSKIYNVFLRGWGGYRQAARIATKYVGGMYRYRSRVGDPDAKAPFVPVPVEEQRQAMALLRDHIFAADAFEFPAELINRLQYEQLPDFSWSQYSIGQVDYPIHQAALQIQQTALFRLYSPYVLGRLMNMSEHVDEGADYYSMYEMFTDTREAIWGEAVSVRSVNTYRRQLQIAHLGHLERIYLSGPNWFPMDARTLAANDIEIIESACENAVGDRGLDEMSRAHFREVLRRIQAIKDARMEYSKY